MARDVAPPLRDGRYRLLDVLGSGGMARVYRAYDERLGVFRAVKLLADRHAPDFALRSWFEEEARVMARLRHRNIVTVYDIDVDNGRPFIVMDLCEGGSLMALVDRVGRVGPGLAADITAQILDALTLAHEADIIHRDVKPHNILFGHADAPMLTDFGVARKPDGEWTPATRQRIMGTPTYMAPEQRANPNLADGRSDLYSLGLTLYVLLTGRQPFSAHESGDAIEEVADIVPTLSEVIRRATRSAPSNRYGSAAEMRAALLEAAADMPVTAPILPSVSGAPVRHVVPPSMPPSAETWPPLPGRQVQPDPLPVDFVASATPAVPLRSAPPGPRLDLAPVFQEEDTLLPDHRRAGRSSLFSVASGGSSRGDSRPALPLPLLVAALVLLVVAAAGLGGFLALAAESVADAASLLSP